MNESSINNIADCRPAPPLRHNEMHSAKGNIAFSNGTRVTHPIPNVAITLASTNMQMHIGRGKYVRMGVEEKIFYCL